jgi:hypothetical protein
MAAGDEHMNSTEARILELSLDHIRSDLARLQEGVAAVAASLQVLPAIQQAQITTQAEMRRGAQVMERHEERLQSIERDLPGLRELRKWVITGVLGGIGMMGLALGKLVIVDVPRLPPNPPITAQSNTGA